MSGADDLREAVARLMADTLYGEMAGDFNEATGYQIKADAYAAANAVLAVLPQHALAVMQHLGTVREGWANNGIQDQTFLYEPLRDTDVPVYLVSLGAAAKEATDASQ